MFDHQEYPQDLTEDEVDLGFRLLEVQDLGGPCLRSYPAVAVVRVLTASEILVKTQAGYSHRIYGYGQMPAYGKKPVWTPLHNLTDDAAQFLQEYDSGVLKPSILSVPNPCEFSSKEPD